MQNLNDLSKICSVLPYAFVPFIEQSQSLDTIDISESNSLSERSFHINSFSENKEKLDLLDTDISSFKMFNDSLSITQYSGLDYKLGVEYTNDKTIFITSIFEKGNIELHIELNFQNEKNTFFAIYEGDDMIDTDILSFDNAKIILKEYFAMKKKTPNVI